MQVVENYIYIIFMTTFNPETGDMLSQLKTFKTLCAAFSTRVPELNGEYGLRRRDGEIFYLVWLGH